MSKFAIHTVPYGDAWANKHEGASKVIKQFPTKEKAEAAGRAIAQRERVDHVIHTADGKIGERHAYGHASHPPAG